MGNPQSPPVILVPRFGSRKEPANGANPFKASGCEEVAYHVEEERRGKADGIDAVQHTTVPLDEGPEVFDSLVAFDSRHGQSAGKSGQGDAESHQPGLEDGKRGSPPK